MSAIIKTTHQHLKSTFVRGGSSSMVRLRLPTFANGGGAQLVSLKILGEREQIGNTFSLLWNVFLSSLEVRVPLLDHHLTSYYLSLPASMRCPQQGVEKYLLRKAFDGTGLLPPEILWRPKEGFSDGVSSVEKPWFKSLQEFASQEVNDWKVLVR